MSGFEHKPSLPSLRLLLGRVITNPGGMESTSGYVVDVNRVGQAAEWLQGRMADIILYLGLRVYPPKIIGALRSEMVRLTSYT